ncbi:proteasome subunit beta type-4-like [Dendronephthya gigantea]|uniref:proteasome subunit beta type-4-like n=1 Tax=Dendronephthya gigantea TaxID=151771 RepID=UPI00106ACB8A|nr:proteasome subunit beta type-4-like [Dendronephthya gigantea]
MAAFSDQEACLWQNGPIPGRFHDFPRQSPTTSHGPSKRSMYPVTQGTSVLGVCFDGGVAIAADTLGSYGSLARFRNLSRLMKVNENTVIGASGDIADFQYIQDVLKQKVIDDACYDDGHGYTPKSIFSWLTRVLYYRRSKFDPLWNQIVVAGHYQGQNFLGYVDRLGIAYEAPSVATGYGAYIAQPLLRDALEKNPHLTAEDAEKLLVKCLEVLYYRDARSLNRYEIAVVKDDAEPVISNVKTIETNWDVAHYVKGYE